MVLQRLLSQKSLDSAVGFGLLMKDHIDYLLFLWD